MSVDCLNIEEAVARPACAVSEAAETVHRATRWELVRRHGWAISLCGLLALVLYWPSVRYDFVNWDDPWYVTENPLITSWRPANLYHIATQVASKNFAPLTIFSYLVDHTIWGLDPAGYHLTNILLHALNVALVYVLIVRLTGSRYIGWATAALFAVHPIQVETVAWVSSRKGLLSAAFTLASLICWLRPDRKGRHEGYGLLFFAGALLSKALAVVIPPVVLLYDVIVRRQSFSSALARQFVPGVMAVLLLLATMTAQNTEIGGVRSHMGLGKARILAVDSVILWKYLGTLAFPKDLCVLYDQPTSGIAAQVALAVAGWIAVAAAMVRFRGRYPLAVLAVCSFFLFLFPVLNFFPISTLMNDRYLYLPCIPVFALAAAGIQRLVQWGCASMRGVETSKLNAFPATNTAAGFLSAAVITVMLIGYSNLTADYLPVWKDGMSLWRDASSKAPQLAVVQIQLANSLHAEGNDGEAVAVLDQALTACRPDELDERRIREKLAAWRAP